MSDRIIMQQMVQITLIVQSISLILGDTLPLSPSSKLNYHFDQGQTGAAEGLHDWSG